MKGFNVRHKKGINTVTDLTYDVNNKPLKVIDTNVTMSNSLQFPKPCSRHNSANCSRCIDTSKIHSDAELHNDAHRMKDDPNGYTFSARQYEDVANGLLFLRCERCGLFATFRVRYESDYVPANPATLADLVARKGAKK